MLDLLCESKPYKENFGLIFGLNQLINKTEYYRGKPGEKRYFIHASPSGISYTLPENINIALLEYVTDNKIDLFIRHAIFEFIHPFCDGNGRTGRMLLLKDCDLDVNKILPQIGQNYISNLIINLKKIFHLYFLIIC